MMRINESFEVHDTLNPKLWQDGSTLRPEVKQKLVEIVAQFEEYIEVPINIVDVQLVGSNVSFNYTSASDLDLHVVANFDSIDADESILQALYNSKKTAFNKTYDISIHGVEIELYIQDVKSATVSNGIYSLCDEAWIKEPKPIKSITKHNTDKEVEKWTEHINMVIKSMDYQELLNTINSLYLMRKNSIAIDGEYGKGNQIFKDIRSKGLLNDLKSALDKSISRKLSLESFNSGQIVNRL